MGKIKFEGNMRERQREWEKGSNLIALSIKIDRTDGNKCELSNEENVMYLSGICVVIIVLIVR